MPRPRYHAGSVGQNGTPGRTGPLGPIFLTKRTLTSNRYPFPPRLSRNARRVQRNVTPRRNGPIEQIFLAKRRLASNEERPCHASDNIQERRGKMDPFKKRLPTKNSFPLNDEPFCPTSRTTREESCKTTLRGKTDRFFGQRKFSPQPDNDFTSVPVQRRTAPAVGREDENFKCSLRSEVPQSEDDGFAKEQGRLPGRLHYR